MINKSKLRIPHGSTKQQANDIGKIVFSFNDFKQTHDISFVAFFGMADNARTYLTSPMWSTECQHNSVISLALVSQSSSLHVNATFNTEFREVSFYL